MFRRALPHKGMRTAIAAPRIVLLDDAITFEGGTNQRVLSLDTLIDQEFGYTDLLVSKILALRPDVLCLSQSVSRTAQGLLLRAHVAVVPGVKPALLQLLSRCSGARILPSTNYIDKLPAADVVGTLAARFVVKVLAVPPGWFDAEDDAEAQPAPAPAVPAPAVSAAAPAAAAPQTAVKAAADVAICAPPSCSPSPPSTGSAESGSAGRGGSAAGGVS